MRALAGRSGVELLRRRRRILGRACGVEKLEARMLLTTFVVRSNADSGDETLRAAILAANASPGLDEIQFELPDGQTTIQVESALPER